MPIDLMAIIEEDLDELPPQERPETCLEGAPEGSETPAVAGDANWQDDPVPTKIEKIRAAFLNGKTASEVEAAAGNMLVGDWLELVAKISPKNIQVQGEMNFRHILAELGPIDKDKYRLPRKKRQEVIDLEPFE